MSMCMFQSLSLSLLLYLFLPLFLSLSRPLPLPYFWVYVCFCFQLPVSQFVSPSLSFSFSFALLACISAFSLSQYLPNRNNALPFSRNMPRSVMKFSGGNDPKPCYVPPGTAPFSIDPNTGIITTNVKLLWNCTDMVMLNVTVTRRNGSKADTGATKHE